MSLFLDFTKCDKCPYAKTERTPGAGYALDYFCSRKNGRKVAGYVEWDSDMPLIPSWCPLYLAEKAFAKAVSIGGEKLEAELLTDPNVDMRDFAKNLFEK